MKYIVVKFKKIMVEHIPREKNTRANVLSKLASMIGKGGNKSIIQKFIYSLNI